MASSRHVGRPVRVQSCAMEPLEGRAHLSGTGLVHTFGSFPDSTSTFGSATLVADGDTAAVVGSLALLPQGRQGRFTTDVVHVYHADTHRWTLAHLPGGPRRLIASVTIGQRAIFAGGSTSSSLTDAVDIYHADTGHWSTSKLPQATQDLDSVGVGHVAIFAGGGLNPRAMIYDARGGRWSTFKLSQGRFNIATASVDGKAILAGGRVVNFNHIRGFDRPRRPWTSTTLILVSGLPPSCRRPAP